MDLSGLASLVFYSEIQGYLRDRFQDFQDDLLGRFAAILGVVALSLLTIWVFYQGWRVLSGRSREPMMALVGDTLKAMLIVGVATGWAGNSATLYESLTEGLGTVIFQAVTGDDADDVDDIYKVMDANLAATTAALGVVSAVQKAGNTEVQGDAMLTEVMTIMGTGGPALMGGTMLTLNKFAMALFTGFGPFFILCLLFDVTRPMFQKWLMYGLGTMFALGALYVLVIITTELMLAVAASYWLNNEFMSQFTGDGGQGLRTVGIQTGGLGIILTMLLISAPPMAANFFSGMLGQISPYALMGPGSERPGQDGRPVPSYQPSSPSHQNKDVQSVGGNARQWGSGEVSSQQASGNQGLANR